MYKAYSKCMGGFQMAQTANHLRPMGPGLTRKTNYYRIFKKQFEFHTMLWPGIIHLIIFAYLPMYGIIIAFQNYSIVTGFLGSQWIGVKHFVDFLTDPMFYRVLRNTIGINILGLIFSFPAPIIFAILLNEIANPGFKRITQTISYLPHFVSWVIFGGLVIKFLLIDGGVINDLLVSAGILQAPVPFLNRPQYFWPIVIISGLIKGLGWGSIIYLAAITGVDAELYEAATIDGAGRFRRIWHITLPSITGTIVIFLIFSISGILNAGFDQIWMLQNDLNIQASEVIDTFVYKVGLQNLRFSYATAVGLARSVVAIILLIGANKLSNAITEKGLF